MCQFENDVASIAYWQLYAKVTIVLQRWFHKPRSKFMVVFYFKLTRNSQLDTRN